jgi:uncharacterized protein YkwD
MKKRKHRLRFLLILIIVIFIWQLIVSVSQFDEVFSDLLSNQVEEAELVCYGDNKTCQIEKELNKFTNLKRQENNLSNLILDSELSNIARDHSEDMISRNFTAHLNPDGLDSTARGELNNYKCVKVHGLKMETGIAENIYETTMFEKGVILGDGENSFFTWYGMDDIATKAVDGWMSSDGHRENLLNAGYTSQGLGVAISEDDRVLITEVFC